MRVHLSRLSLSGFACLSSGSLYTIGTPGVVGDSANMTLSPKKTKNENCLRPTLVFQLTLILTSALESGMNSARYKYPRIVAIKFPVLKECH